MLPLLWQTCVKISGGAFRDFVSAMEGQTVVGFLPQPPKTLPPPGLRLLRARPMAGYRPPLR